MFNVGGMELLVIALVALVVLGPEKLPGAIRQLGRVTGELRRISSGFQTDLQSAIDQAERDAEREMAADSARSERPGPQIGSVLPVAKADAGPTAADVAAAELAAMDAPEDENGPGDTVDQT